MPEVKIPAVAVVNQKGGTGKSVTAANVAWVFAHTQSRRVLAVDLDPQGNLSTMLGQEPTTGTANMTNVFEGRALNECVTALSDTLDLVMGDPGLADVEFNLGSQPRREELLTRQLEGECDDYDLVILDVPPNQGLLAVNAMVFATTLLVPVRMDDANAVNGLSDLLRFAGRLADVGWARPIARVVPLDVNGRLDICETLKDALVATGLAISECEIPSRTAVAKSVALGTPITAWKPASDAAQAYVALAAELAEVLELPARAKVA